MARSQYIYLIMSESYEPQVVAAFTVKHETFTALARLRKERTGVDYGVYRVRDNGKPWDEPQKVEDDV